MAGIKGHYIYDLEGNIIDGIGGKKAALTNKKQHGDNFYSEIGRIGGAVKGVKKGFAANNDLAKQAGSLGGKNSKRIWTPYERAKHGRLMKEAWAKRNEDEV